MNLNVIRSILQNASGEYEVGRTMLAVSGLAGIVTPIAFQVTDMWHNGWHFDVTAWCLAYPGGLGALNGIGVFTIGRKEVAVAQARQMVAQPPLADKSTVQQ